ENGELIDTGPYVAITKFVDAHGDYVMPAKTEPTRTEAYVWTEIDGTFYYLPNTEEAVGAFADTYKKVVFFTPPAAIKGAQTLGELQNIKADVDRLRLQNP